MTNKVDVIVPSVSESVKALTKSVKVPREPGKGRCRGTKWKQRGKTEFTRRCEDCAITFTSTKQLEDHKKGKKHRLKVNWLNRCLDNPLKAKLQVVHKKSFTCFLCDVTTTSYKLMEQHKLGKPHQLRQRAEDGDKTAVGVLKKRKLIVSSHVPEDPSHKSVEKKQKIMERNKVNLTDSKLAKENVSGCRENFSKKDTDSVDSSVDSSDSDDSSDDSSDSDDNAVSISENKMVTNADMSSLLKQQAEIAAKIADAELKALLAQQNLVRKKIEELTKKSVSDAKAINKTIKTTQLAKETLRPETPTIISDYKIFNLSKISKDETRTELRVRKLRELRQYMLDFQSESAKLNVRGLIHLPGQTSDDRKLAHSVAGELGLNHLTEGTGIQRHVVISM